MEFFKVCAALGLVILPAILAAPFHSRIDSPGSGTFDLYYKTLWAQTFLHYNPDNQGWNPIPGAQFNASQNTTFPASDGWVFIEVSGNAVVFVTSDGKGNYDNNDGNNYITSLPGIYSLSLGDLQAIQTFSKGCPGTPPCSGHGACNGTTGECVCTSGYYGPACSVSCPGAPDAPCSGHGTCGANGTCQCSAGFASCTPALDCSTPVSQDPNNCGGCGMKCVAGPGVVSATCANSACNIVCKPGLSHCLDNSCQASCPLPPLPGCQTYTDNQCAGNTIITPTNYTARRWQTPKAGTPDYRPSYQSMATLQGHAQVMYNADQTIANVTVVTVLKDPTVTLQYSFDGAAQASPTKVFQKSDAPDGTTITVTGSDSSSLKLQPLNFIWSNPNITNQVPGDYRNGQKGAIVELFGWPHSDIAQECAFLASKGYLGVKVYPVMEQIMSYEPFQNVVNPWFFMYQPVSYNLNGRMGTREDLRTMITTCRKLGVRVYADAVVNHMTGNGNDGNPHHRDNNCVYFPEKNSSDPNTSPMFTQGYCYMPNENTGLPPSQEFPAVPYGPTDFHCERVLNSWTDPLDLNAGWLTGLTDLNTEKENVQQRIADYLTDLLGIGFSGFRIDAAKHMKPDDLVAIFSKLKANLGGSLPEDFIVWMEVLLGGEADMLLCNADSGYNYGKYLETALNTAGFTAAEIDQLKIWFSAYPKQPDADCGALNMQRKVIQNDDADQQNSGSTSRDMQDFGSVLVKDRDIPKHRGFEVQLFTAPRGSTDNDNDYPIRVILSSYYFDISQQPYGIPDGNSDCAKCAGPSCGSCQGSMPKTAAFNDNAQGYAGPVYTRVHRDGAIIGAMQGWMKVSNTTAHKG